jgi:hypothetical protein
MLAPAGCVWFFGGSGNGGVSEPRGVRRHGSGRRGGEENRGGEVDLCRAGEREGEGAKASESEWGGGRGG